MSELEEIKATLQTMDNTLQKKREHNIKCSTSVLMNKKVKFESKSEGNHLVITHSFNVIDFWPATGRWIVRKSPKEGRGVFKLLKWLGVK